MDLPFPWTFVLFTLCFVALIAGALLGFAVGFRTGGRQERFRLVKEKLKRNKAAICRWQKERYEYARQVKQLEEDLLHSASDPNTIRNGCLTLSSTSRNSGRASG